MPNTIHKFLSQQIQNATIFVLNENNPPPEIPLEYYADEILRKTLQNCAHFFLKKSTLRKSEQDTLLQLNKTLKEEMDLIKIEEQLVQNLHNIKPTWGEFFGKDRGEVYNTFKALQEWPCFHWRARLHYKEQYQQQLNIQMHAQNKQIAQDRDEMSDISKLIQDHETTTNQLTQRSAQQFITIQQLQLELQTAKQTIRDLEEQLKTKNPPAQGSQKAIPL